MDCKKSLEKHTEKDVEDHSDPLPAVDVEVPQDPPRIHSFSSYPAPSYASHPRRSGMYVPTPLFVLFILLFLFESSVLFVYTVVALYNTLPASLVPAQSPYYPCEIGNDHAPINVAPNIWLPAAAITTTIQTTQHEVTVTITATPSNMHTSSGEGNVSETLFSSSTTAFASSSTSSTSVNSSAVESSEAAIAALVSAITHQETGSSGVVTVTAAVPTVTVLSTASEALPSITVLTVLSTATPIRSTVTSVATITA